MCKFQCVGKACCLSLAASALVYMFGIQLAAAQDYTYSLFDLPGSITTTCDNCVLNSGDIVAWHMSESGFLSIASTSPGASLSVPAGDTDMMATPTGINFNFNAPYGGFTFSTPAGFVGYDDDQGSDIGFGPGVGVVAICQRPSYNCMFTGGSYGVRTIAAAPVATSAPELDAGSIAGALTLLFGLVAVIRGRRPPALNHT